MASFMSQEFEMDSTYDSDISAHHNSSVVGPVPLTHQLQFSDKSGILVKISRAIFDDFKSRLCADSTDFKTILKGFAETCEFAVQSIKKLSDGKHHVDANSKLIFSQLSLEYNAYDLMLRVIEANESVGEMKDPDSFLMKFFAESVEFRRLLVLLRWNEEAAFRNPSGFSATINDIRQLDSINNIYATTAMRGKMAHIDSRFDGSAEREDEEQIILLHKVYFALLRCGRLTEARRLVHGVGLAAMGSFVFHREFLFNPSLTPLDSLNDNYNLAKSRVFCKQAARELIPIDDTISAADQCIWATLSSSLPTLLSHASSTEDRLWAYLSCGTDSLLDDYMLNIHSRNNEDVICAKNELFDEDVPRSIDLIFSEIGKNESSVYYCLFGYLAMENWEGAVDYIQSFVYKKQGSEIPAHELRFLTHLVLLFKISNRTTNHTRVCDLLVEKFADLLIEMKLYSLIPGYLIHMSTAKSKTKMLSFLQGVENASEQQEVLSFAHEAGFNISELCKDVYLRFKQKNHINSDDEETGRAAAEMLRAWRWLSYGGVETIYDAIVEANYLLRKLLRHNHIAEAMELLLITPDNLSSQVDDVYAQNIPGLERPQRLSEAQDEFDCYVLYFEAMKHYNMWQKHIEGTPAPEMPAKLSDEHWARLDLRRREEYGLSMMKAKDCLQKYMKLSESLKKRAVKLLKGVLCKKGGWLCAESSDEDSSVVETRERTNDFNVIRNNYFFHITKCLIAIYTKVDDQASILEVATLLVDPRYKLDKSLTKENLRKLLAEISKSGVALL